MLISMLLAATLLAHPQAGQPLPPTHDSTPLVSISSLVAQSDASNNAPVLTYKTQQNTTYSSPTSHWHSQHLLHVRHLQQTSSPPASNSTVSASPALVAGLSTSQMQNAETIISVGKEMGISKFGQEVAIATAMQESTLQNLSYGDRDSLGLFQQRPSAGWGTPSEITSPRYASRAFYNALVQVQGWQGMPLTVAAQTVQQSAFPDAYAQWAGLAQQVVGAIG